MIGDFIKEGLAFDIDDAPQPMYGVAVDKADAAATTAKFEAVSWPEACATRPAACDQLSYLEFCLVVNIEACGQKKDDAGAAGDADAAADADVEVDAVAAPEGGGLLWGFGAFLRRAAPVEPREPLPRFTGPINAGGAGYDPGGVNSVMQLLRSTAGFVAALRDPLLVPNDANVVDAVRWAFGAMDAGGSGSTRRASTTTR